MLTAYIDNGNVLTITITNSITEAADTGATVTVTIVDSAAADVTGGDTWPLSVPHVAAGLYRVTLDSANTLTSLRNYTAQVTATGTGSEAGYWECPIQARTRACS